MMQRRFEYPESGPYAGEAVVTFDSVDALVSNACTFSGISKNKEEFRHHEKEWNESTIFYNNYSMQRVERELTEPPDCSARVEALRSAIQETHNFSVTRRRLRRRREDGDELDPMAWIQRDPQGWSRIEHEQSGRKAIRLGVNLAISCGHGPKDLWPRGAACAALADALEYAGHSVEIWAFWRVKRLSYEKTNMHTIRVLVKPAHMPLDISTLALVIAEIGFKRVILFQAAVNCLRHEHQPGLGFPESIGAERAECDVVFDADIKTLDAAKAAVKKYADQFSAGKEC